MPRAKPFSAIALLSFLPLFAAARLQAAGPLDKSFTLEDAERLAILNDAKLLSAQQNEIISSERVDEAEYLFLPEFGLQATATRYNANYPFSPTGSNLLLFPKVNSAFGSPTGNIYSGYGYLNMSLYEGGRTLNTLRLAQAAQKQAVNDEESVRLNVLLATKKVFYRLILAQEKAAEWKKYSAEIENLISRRRLRSWKGLEAQAELESAREQTAQARHELELARLSFLKGLNLELDTSFQVVGTLKTTPVSIDIEKAVLWALELRPELRAQTYKAQMDAISVNLALARRIPTIFLSGDYGLTGTDVSYINLNNWDATVGIRIPFTYDYWSQIKEKQAEQRQGELTRADLQDQVRLQVRQAYETLQYWQKEYPLRQEQYEKFKGLYAQLASQKAPETLDQIRTMRTLLDLRLSYLDAVTEHILAEAGLERAVGRPIDE